MGLKINMLLLFIGLSFQQSYAQMGTASTVEWDIDESLEVSVSQDSIWRLLKNYSLVSKLSNGWVASVVNKDDILPIDREVTFNDGSVRQELLSQVDDQHRFLVFSFKDKSLPAGVSTARVAIFTKALSAERATLSWKVLVEGKKADEAQLVQQLREEIAQYKIGFLQFLQPKPTSIKAIRMQ